MTTLDAEIFRGVRGLDHFLRGALLDFLRLAVAPDMRGQNRLVPLIDGIADGLADEVARDGPGLQAVLGKKRVAVVAIFFVLRLGDVEMIAPAGEFKAVVAERSWLFVARVSRGRSAHWPVKRVMGRGMMFYN